MAAMKSWNWNISLVGGRRLINFTTSLLTYSISSTKLFTNSPMKSLDESTKWQIARYNWVILFLSFLSSRIIVLPFYFSLFTRKRICRFFSWLNENEINYKIYEKIAWEFSIQWFMVNVSKRTTNNDWKSLKQLFRVSRGSCCVARYRPSAAVGEFKYLHIFRSIPSIREHRDSNANRQCRLSSLDRTVECGRQYLVRNMIQWHCIE